MRSLTGFMAEHDLDLGREDDLVLDLGHRGQGVHLVVLVLVFVLFSPSCL